jgi:hypothetical protein
MELKSSVALLVTEREVIRYGIIFLEGDYYENNKIFGIIVSVFNFVGRCIARFQSKLAP